MQQIANQLLGVSSDITKVTKPHNHAPNTPARVIILVEQSSLKAATELSVICQTRNRPLGFKIVLVKRSE